LAQTLAIEEDPGSSVLESIRDWLDARRILLVLDNLEQIGDIGPLVADLIGTNPHLRIVATSRSPIRVRGEREVPIDPLAVPNLKRLPRLEVLSQYDSVALFIERARAVQPSFVVTNDTAPAVAEICVRLDGLPLAIELAAARIRLLPPAVMLERLTTRLPLLINGSRDLPLRHQTLRGTIAWSYDLLTPAEQALFRRLAVFHGRASLPAVTSVSEDIELDPLTGLERLAGHSLVRPLDEPDQAAVTMLETIREYGMEQLIATGELESTRARHGAWFASVAAEAFPHLLGHEQVVWFDTLATEQDNLQAALRWAIHADINLAVTMAAHLWWFWYVRGQLRLARDLVGAALAATPGIESVARARALHGSATLAYVMGDAATARTNGEAALALNRQLGNEPGIPTNLNHLANVALHDDPDRAQGLYEECLAISERLGDDNVAAVAMLNLGSLAVRRGDLDDAIHHYEAALIIWRRTGDLGSQAVALANLGTITLLSNGSVESALDWFDQSLVIARELGDQVGVLTCLAGYANALGMTGHMELAARLRGAVESLRMEPGELDDPVMADIDQSLLAHVQEALGDARFFRLTAEGKDWSMETALAEVERTRHGE
jgi:predicted ATPase